MAEIAHLEAAHEAFEEGGEAQGAEDERDECPSEESTDELWHQQEQEDEDEQQQEEEEEQELSPGLGTASAQSPPLPPQLCELRADSDAVAAQLLLAADDDSGGPQPQPLAPSPLPPHSRLHPAQQARSPLLQRKLAVPKQLRRGRSGGGGRVPNPPRDIMPKWSSEEEAVEEEAGAGAPIVAVPQPKAARARGSVAARQPRPRTAPATAAAARSRTAAHAAARGVATAAAPHRRVARATAPKAVGSGVKLGVASGGKKRKPKKKKAVAAVAVAAVAKALPVASAAARPVTAPARRSSDSGAPAPLKAPKPAPVRAGASLAGAALAARGAPRLPKADPVARFQQVQQQWAKKQAAARRRQREVQDSVRRDMRMAAAMTIAPRRTKPAKPSPDFVAPSEKRRDALRMRVRRQMQTTQLAATTMTGTRLL